MSSSRWTAGHVPDLSGRTAVVTGANTGLGRETATVLAARGAHVVLAVRDLDKGKAAMAAITAEHPEASVALQHLDLASLASVRAAADELRAEHERIDLLVNNAGVMWTPKGTTADGFELQLGTNHLGHFAFTGLLLDRLAGVEGARVVTVSSVAHRYLADIHFDDLHWERRRYDRIGAYAQSKLANLLFTYELQRRLAAAGAAAIAVAAHPGGSSTELMRSSPVLLRTLNAAFGALVMQPAAMGALPILRAATDPEVQGGQYYGPAGPGEVRGYPKVVSSSGRSHDVERQRRLWAVSTELTGVTFPV